MNSGHNSPFDPTDRMLQQFSVLWIIFFGVNAAVQEFQHHRHFLAIGLAVLALTVGPLGLAWRRAIKPIFIGSMALVFPIGWIISHVVLSFLFYGLFTPVAWFFRMRGRDNPTTTLEYGHSAFLLVSLSLYSAQYQEAAHVPGIADGRGAVCAAPVCPYTARS